jgi:hypothetical protein
MSRVLFQIYSDKEELEMWYNSLLNKSKLSPMEARIFYSLAKKLRKD